MTWRDPWAILGIAATGDERAIRRAYAARLKVTNPEDDAEGFQTLRAAYEHALAMARHWDDEADEDQALEPAAVSVTAAEAADPDPEPEIEPAAPAGPWGAAREAAEHVTRAELDALNEAMARLAEMVHAPEVDRDAARRALRMVLDMPAMDSMGVREQVEHQIGAMIVNSGMGGAVLIDPSSAAFGWDSERIGARSPLGAAVLARREDLSFLLTLKSSGHELNGAWRALTEKPKGQRLIWNHLTLALPGQVRRVLEALYQQHRSLIGELDEDAVAWWQARLERPWFGPAMVWSALVAPVILTPMLAGSNVFGQEDGRAFAMAYPASLGAVLLLLGSVLGLLRAQNLWRREREYVATAWETLGWAPLALTSFVGAALAPAWAPAFAAAGLAAAIWAVVTAPGGQGAMADEVWSFPASWFPWIQVPFRAPVWAMRAFGLAAPAFFWIALAESHPHSARAAVMVAACAGGVAFVAGHDRLEAAWRGLAEPARTAALIAGLVAVAGLPYWLWSTAPDPGLVPIAFAVVTAVVLLERIVSPGAPARLLRDQLYHLGWVPALFAAALAEENARHGNAVLLFLGMWLLAGAAAGLLGELRRERWRRAAYA